jgi:hypothetical protein
MTYVFIFGITTGTQHDKAKAAAAHLSSGARQGKRYSSRPTRRASGF